MLEHAILVLATALDPAEVSQGLEMLGNVELPGTTKYLAAPGKVDGQSLAKTLNVEGGYPAAPPWLQSLQAWADVRDEDDSRFRDAYDLFSLRAVLARTDPFDYVILVGEGGLVSDDWTNLLGRLGTGLFLSLSENAGRKWMLFNLTSEGSSDFLDSAWELYVTGAAYGISGYSFEQALRTAADAQRLEQQIH